MPQCTSATFSRVERAGPGWARCQARQTAAVNRPADRPNQHEWHECHLAAPARRRPPCPEPVGTGRGGARLGWGGAGTLPRVVEDEVREDLPDDK